MSALQMDTTTEWDPTRFLPPFDFASGEAAYAVIILNNPIEHVDVVVSITRRVAADGGANRLFDAGLATQDSFHLDVITGDLDSLRPDVSAHFAARGTAVVRDDSQYRDDFRKALLALASDYAGPPLAAALVHGGLGGRADQAFAQLHQLYLYATGAADQSAVTASGPPVYLLAGDSVVFALRPGRHVVRTRRREGREAGGRPALGKNVGIIPLGGPAVISTRGLEWDVQDWPTSFGTQVSTSNYVREDDVMVVTDQTVLFSIDLNLET